MSFCSFCLWAFSLTNESTDRPTPPFPQQVLKVDEEARTVTVQPGVKVGDLCEYLIANHGLTLENLASIAEQQVGGFVSVGAHGTGARLPSVDMQVESIKVGENKREREREREGRMGLFQEGWMDACLTD